VELLCGDVRWVADFGGDLGTDKRWEVGYGGDDECVEEGWIFEDKGCSVGE
jgi:hypothetical protein